VAIWQYFGNFRRIFTAHVQKPLFVSFRSKFGPFNSATQIS